MSDLSYTIGLDGSGFLAAASRAISVMGSMELAVQGIVRAAGLMTSAFAEAADLEGVTTAIDTLTKSAATTAQVMGDLRKLAANTPLEMSELAPAARMLLGAGTSAKEVAKQLRVLGDVASGAGTDLLGIVTVFNQVRGKGKMLTEEFMQFAERGVAGLREEIAKLKGIPIDAVGDAMSRGMVSARDLEAVFTRMTSAGGIAFNAMAKQAETFNGKLSTLRDAWTSLQVAFAAPINDALKPVIEDITRLTESLAPAFGVIGQQAAEVVTAVHAFLAGLSQGQSATSALGEAFGGLIEKAWQLARVPLDAIGAALPSLGQAFMDLVMPAGDWLFARLSQAAHTAAAILMEGVGKALTASILTRSIGNSLLQAAPAQRDAAAVAALDAQGISNVDMAAGLMRASTDLSAAAQALRDTFGAALDSFVRGMPLGSEQAGAGASAEAAAEAVSRRIIAKIETPQGNYYTTLPSRQPDGSDTAQVVDALRQMLTELQRITSY